MASQIMAEMWKEPWDTVQHSHNDLDEFFYNNSGKSWVNWHFITNLIDWTLHFSTLPTNYRCPNKRSAVYEAMGERHFLDDHLRCRHHCGASADGESKGLRTEVANVRVQCRHDTYVVVDVLRGNNSPIFLT